MSDTYITDNYYQSIKNGYCKSIDNLHNKIISSSLSCHYNNRKCKSRSIVLGDCIQFIYYMEKIHEIERIIRQEVYDKWSCGFGRGSGLSYDICCEIDKYLVNEQNVINCFELERRAMQMDLIFLNDKNCVFDYFYF